MTEQELRTLVRQAIARHKGESPSAPLVPLLPFAPVVPALGASHGMFVLTSGADADGPCIIEPRVMCNHCGYCKSLGH
jgi:hypothetical protein